MRRLAMFLFSLCLALPALAADAAKPERKEVFGNVTVHYSVFNSTFVQPATAQAAGLIRSKNQGVINITVLKDGKPAVANVSGTVADLTSRQSNLSFKQVTDQGAVYYLAQFPVEQEENRTFAITVGSGETNNSFSFTQTVFPGE
ncbi:DUF4426 domain-containing protein [Pseudomonas sp. 148P]|uniref:DUF4426 domain-containing protein n=1 Tax=Pseudomonas ulcerans TaxID=3115852 RepID=A0ABU7HMI0_9PSED|nr:MULTISPECIES: DUF4426 domain-containing protein [unclassified Pseudomonas]MEE1921723.1 DUF4426 domain-containing protein [Pseudomonas sp. 147P]MEE1932718.1 DUF4426 domain-containing protein [Pseudomonas sp. 148P]